MDVDARLEELDIQLPEAAVPAANYVSYQFLDGTLYVSGQLPMEKGSMLYSGQVGQSVTLEQAQQAARVCAINILSQLKAACHGDWSRVKQCVRLGVFVSSGPEFHEAHLVANGASDLIAEVLGGRGKHARAAVCCSALPLNAPVEVEALFRLES